MFTEKSRAGPEPLRRGPGRPRGRTEQGEHTRERLYALATRLIAERGYEQTTLRELALKGNVSVGLLYRYFPSKRAVVLALHDELSATYAARAAQMPRGKWPARAVHALETSLEVLRPHRDTLSALVPVLVGPGEESLFAPATTFARRRVLAVFDNAVTGATDAPMPSLAAALGRLLYLGHLAVILWWLLDRSEEQRATARLLALIRRALPFLGMSSRLSPIRGFVIAADRLVRDAFLDSVETH